MIAPRVGGRPVSHHRAAHGGTADDGNVPSAPGDGVDLAIRMPQTQVTPPARPRESGAGYKFRISTGGSVSAGSNPNTRA